MSKPPYTTSGASRPRAARSGTTRTALLSVLLLVSGAAACRTPYRYSYENKTGVGLLDRTTDYCQKAAAKQGYMAIRGTGPNTKDSPSQVDQRLRVNDGHGELVVSCEFDDAKRVATIPKAQRGDLKRGEIGYISSDVGKARTVCQTAVKGSGYDIQSAGPAQWTGGRQFRVNVSVRQGGAERNVACRYDGVAGTAAVPTVTKEAP
ncbi:MAG: hypothetical protein H7Z40_14195 [Phycisphaerae bacterium]|nr:hypothetical protein [Gemmatimonadaceae bacterium]